MRVRRASAWSRCRAVTGALIQWLRDRLGLIGSAPEVEALAASVDDNGGVYFVPAFSGLFAPYWRDDARGVIVGLTGYANRGRIARAALEATAWQSREVVDAANAVADVRFSDCGSTGA
jgi:glycerol kinase